MIKKIIFISVAFALSVNTYAKGIASAVVPAAAIASGAYVVGKAIDADHTAAQTEEQRDYDLQIEVCNSQLTPEKRLKCLTDYNQSIIDQKKAWLEYNDERNRQFAKITGWFLAILIGGGLLVAAIILIYIVVLCVINYIREVNHIRDRR
jgi:hypothetical protein